MRRAVSVFILILCLAVLGFGVSGRLVRSGSILPSLAPSPDSGQLQPLNSPVAHIAVPAFISIPKLNIRVKIEQVGLDSSNAMAVPSDENNAGWYNLGVKPGETGNSVIAAHYDKKDGSPGAFFSLNKLIPGDQITVEDSEGKEIKFRVTETASYKLERFPLQGVFGSYDKPRLNLITCEGVFDKNSSLYSHRLVVYSEAI